MNEPLEYKGYWWLPEDPDNKVVGVLKYSPGERIVLELIGSFKKGQALPIHTDSYTEAEVVLGLSLEAKEITLFNCCKTDGQSNNSVNISVLKYLCNYLLIGEHLTNFKVPKFFKATIQMHLLSEWCSPRVKPMCDFQETADEKTIQFKKKGEVLSDVDINDNTKFMIVDYVRDRLDNNNDINKITITRTTCLEITKKTDACLPDFLKDIFLYEQFISFATLTNISSSKIEFFDRENYEDFKGQKFYNAVQLIHTVGEPSSNANKRRHGFLFTFNLLKDNYLKVLKKWYNEDTSIAPIRQHLIESIRPYKTFSSKDFLVVIQAIDGFCIRFREKRRRLKCRLEDLLSEFACIDKIAKEEIDMTIVVSCRDYYSHFYTPDDRTILDGIELYKLTHQLRMLLVCCMLHYMGLSYSDINTILNNSQSNVLASLKSLGF